MFFNEENGSVRCGLCPRYCLIPSGGFGSCGARGNKNGKGLIPFYGLVTALALDPIEKKPLYRFRPGTMILSAGFAGCNFRCPFCQNWRISQIFDDRASAVSGREMRPRDLVSEALRQGSSSIAYTYSEPLIHVEYLLDCMNEARKHGIANVIVTNGCVNAVAAEEILSLTDAANVDLKCFSPDIYAKILCENSAAENILETVLAFIRLAWEKGVHTEITTLVVPGLNDTDEELDACADFIASTGKEIPWHLSAYRPEYRWNAPPADPEFILRAKKRAEEKLSFVYTNILNRR